jgi:hypothetical protein
MPLWLSMGSDCAPLWIAAGGEPWRVWSYFGANTHVCYAHVAARGGSKAIWKILADRLADPAAIETLAIEDGKATTIGLAIVHWENTAAIEALGGAGWTPSRTISNEAAKDAACHLAQGNKGLAARSAKLCQALGRAGASAPDWEQVRISVGWMVGTAILALARDLVDPAFARGQAQALRAASARPKSRKKPAAARL